jgi:hypothetical protein
MAIPNVPLEIIFLFATIRTVMTLQSRNLSAFKTKMRQHIPPVTIQLCATWTWENTRTTSTKLCNISCGSDKLSNTAQSLWVRLVIHSSTTCFQHVPRASAWNRQKDTIVSVQGAKTYVLWQSTIWVALRSLLEKINKWRFSLYPHIYNTCFSQFIREKQEVYDEFR